MNHYIIIALSTVLIACTSPAHEEGKAAAEVTQVAAKKVALKADAPVDKDLGKEMEQSNQKTADEMQDSKEVRTEKPALVKKEEKVEKAKKIDKKKEEQVEQKVEHPAKKEALKDQETVDGKIMVKGSADEVDPGLPRKDAPATAVLPNHDDWDALLNTYVSAEGSVNYQGLKKEEGKLDTYLGQISDQSVSDDWSRGEKMAYWINAYNAYTVKLILDNYPLGSITDLDNGKPWDRKWIMLDGKTLSLNDIEHTILRPQFKDPRIHFAVNCAAQSCPPIPNKAFTAANLDKLLEERTRAFINDPQYNTIGASKAEVSQIFDWYGEDFGDLKAYLNKYAKEKIESSTEVAFRAYDWNLNGK